MDVTQVLSMSLPSSSFLGSFQTFGYTEQSYSKVQKQPFADFFEIVVLENFPIFIKKRH